MKNLVPWVFLVGAGAYLVVQRQGSVAARLMRR